jgi:DNA-binding MarR family transcriptional regulator
MRETRIEKTMEVVRSMNELRNNIRQFIQLNLREYNFNITFEMLEVMFHLWRKDNINQKELADITFRDKSSMTYVLDNLVKRNLVTRVEDGSDRRSKRVVLTADGRKLEETLHPMLMDLYDVAAGTLTDVLLEQGCTLINAMTINLKRKADLKSETI